ncbi:MAG: HpcH/HpaI aldolase/citrate lyase family protein [Acetobacteraceae bacterium]|nr:HpcH/HpaI aldolase/citrate lyase family protein [Acetobacteraceae bacterium]
MDLPRNEFKRAITSGRLQLGLWSSLASYVTVEVLAGAGFDWLLLDTEHAANELPMIHTQLLAAKGGTAHPIVRPAWNDAVLLKRLLDVGVQSFLIPYVQTEQEARQAVAATRYPPGGFRGFASASRASGFGRIGDYYARCEEEICVLLQVETQLALDNLEAIARVEGVDGVFIGPGDLSASLGYLGQPGHPDVQEVVLKAIRRIRECGKAPGVLTGDEALARRYIEGGCLFTAVGADIAILARGAEALAARFKGADAG